MKGVRKFLDKVVACAKCVTPDAPMDKSLETLLHQTIKKVGDDIDNFGFNTAIAQLMTMTNTLKTLNTIPQKIREPFVILLSPFAPHLAEELWEQMGNEFSIFTKAQWPKYNSDLLVEQNVEIAIQINGKLRDTIKVARDQQEQATIEQAQASPKIQKHLTNKTIHKHIYIPGKIINFVVK